MAQYWQVLEVEMVVWQQLNEHVVFKRRAGAQGCRGCRVRLYILVGWPKHGVRQHTN
jgi:hypothetical protein